MDKDLMAEYGQRCLEVEIANGRLTECKQRVAKAIEAEQRAKGTPPAEVKG
jgi:hypothetical protein